MNGQDEDVSHYKCLYSWLPDNEFVGSSVQVTCYNGVLTVTSPTAELIEIYSMSSSLLYNARKDSGTATFRIGGTVPRGILVVRGSSGWSRKVLLN